MEDKDAAAEKPVEAPRQKGKISKAPVVKKAKLLPKNGLFSP